MPIYEYRCETCGERFDRLFLTMSRIPTEIACPICQGVQVKRLLSVPAIHTGTSEPTEDSSSHEHKAAPPSADPAFLSKDLINTLRQPK